MCRGQFLDLQKAFDTVDHGILDKLCCYGMRGSAYECFVSYLSSRQQSVMYNGHESELKVVRAMRCSSGVHPGIFALSFVKIGWSNGLPGGKKSLPERMLTSR